MATVAAPLGRREQIESVVVAQRRDCHVEAPRDLPMGSSAFRMRLT
jgi:hypothetical protein